MPRSFDDIYQIAPPAAGHPWTPNRPTPPTPPNQKQPKHKPPGARLRGPDNNGAKPCPFSLNIYTNSRPRRRSSA